MNEIENVNIELRSLQKSIEDGKINGKDAKAKLDELKQRKFNLEQVEALKEKPADVRTSKATDIAKAMIEKRTITLNGTGAINQVKELVLELQKKTPVLQRVKYFYGANANTYIPVLTPSIATPGNYAEGATGIVSDTQAALGNVEIKPYAYVSILPITAEALQLGSVNLEAELPTIFGNAFAQAFHNGILSGDGTGRNFKGMFTSAAANADNVSGSIDLNSLAALALKIQDTTDNGVIVMHPAIYSQMMATSTDLTAPIYKEELIRNKRIEGVEVILTTGAPSATSGIVAVAGKLDNYAVGMASEVSITPKTIVGDTHTYFEAMVFANGRSIIEKEFYGLVV